MSAIAGLWYRSGRILEPTELDRMREVLAHRGKDGSGTWHRGAFGCLQQLMYSTPESFHEQLPLVSENGRRVLVCDARLDNRDTLSRALSISDGPETPDSTFVLAAYERWGTSAPERLLGAFCFAIWDDVEQRLFCARDHIGFRPFYFYSATDVFAFGSEIKAILSLPEVPRVLNEERVAEFLTERFDDRESTFYRDVSRLPSGCWMTVDRDRHEVHQYWRLRPEVELTGRSDDDYASEFLDLLKSAVDVRIRTAYTPGAHLSGGLDSASIVILARELLDRAGRGPVHGFTARFPALRSCDEGPYADAVAALEGVVSHVVYPEDENLLDDLDQMLWHHDEPFPLPTWVLERTLYQAAGEAGVRVLLSGSSGDVTLSHGDGWFQELLMRGRWKTLLHESGAFCDLRSLPLKSFLWQEAAEPAVRSLVPRPMYHAWWRFKGREKLRQSILHEDLDNRLDYSKRILERSLDDMRLKRTQRGYHFFRMNDDWIARSVETGDLLGAAFGQRTAYPFFDKRMLEFGLALPGDQKMADGYSRIVLRRAMEGRLPDVLQRRWTKTGLVPLVRRSLFDQNMDYLERFAGEDLSELDGLVNTRLICESVRRAARGGNTEPRSFRSEVWSVLSAVMLARWLRLAKVSRSSGA